MPVTVIDVLRSMGIEPTKQVSWAIGLAVVGRYKQLNDGELPIKDLRTKTSGVGVHCFAIYPDTFRPEIVSIIDDYFDRRYTYRGRTYSLAELARLRGVSVSTMRSRLRSFNTTTAMMG